jgi:hypothetical protein
MLAYIHGLIAGNSTQVAAELERQRNTLKQLTAADELAKTTGSK